MGFLCVVSANSIIHRFPIFLCLLPLFSLRYPFEVNGLNLRKCPNETVPDFLLRTPSKMPSVPAETADEANEDNDKTRKGDGADTKNNADTALSQPGAKDF